MRLRTYLICAGIVFFLTLVVMVKLQRDKIAKLKADNARIETNWFNEIQDKQVIVNLILKEEEQTKRLTIAKDSLARELKIKPRQIEKLIYITTIDKDTIEVPVYVTITGKSQWNISDQGKCFKWAGNALLLQDSLKVVRTNFEYTNKTTEVFYRERPYKFLFIRFGKWVYKQKIDSDCGESSERAITFIK